MKPPPQIEKSWAEALQEEWKKPYMDNLAQFLARERSSGASVYPPKQDVFNAFNQTSLEGVRVVIIGQDPYHGQGQAHGLSFSVPRGVRQPPSLKNIFKELQDDLGIEPPNHGNLEEWAKQGVLMLNAILTVRAGEPRSHHGKGWEEFTDGVVQVLNARLDPVIFVLWGKSAQDKCGALASHHYVLTASHPSPYSAHSGFFGCRHFSKINELLKKQGKQPINWALS
ncbi:MAG: uracil-DNA glycosylase [Chlamydiales bacterium]|nr:uracil-DNA glycosylase [Chlamydiales bacterium]